jgi:hypothetical protein
MPNIPYCTFIIIDNDNSTTSILLPLLRMVKNLPEDNTTILNAMILTAVDWERRMNHQQAIQATNEWQFGIVVCYVAGCARFQ